MVMFRYTSNAYTKKLLSVNWFLFYVDMSQIEFQLGRPALYIPRVLHTSEMNPVSHPLGQRPSVTAHVD